MNTTIFGERKNIIIIDDHPAILEGIRSVLERETDFQIVGTADDGFKAIEMVKSLKPDIVIMDYSMPNMDGLDATKEIHKISGNTRIIIYSMLSDKKLVSSLFMVGISGYVLKGQHLSEIVMAIRSVASGGTYFSTSIGSNLREYLLEEMNHGQEEDALKKLSKRETEIFLLLADGLTSREIADRLFISQKTVETHKYNLMYKLEISSVAQLTKVAVKKGLIKF